MPPLTPRQVRRARRWMTIVLLGLFIFVIGVQPDILGLNRSLTVGFVQIGVWLTGLAILLLAAYATVRVVRNGKENSTDAFYYLWPRAGDWFGGWSDLEPTGRNTVLASQESNAKTWQ